MNRIDRLSPVFIDRQLGKADTTLHAVAAPPSADDLPWHHGLPEQIVFVDVETTGLHSADRIVSLAAIKLKTHSVANGSIAVEYIHLVFDPGRKSHSRAEAVHGRDDWELRHQPPFAEYADTIEFFLDAGMIVAHNLAFDRAFIDREFATLGKAPLVAPGYCTMQNWRALGLGRASLDAICAYFGWPRSTVHGALEDAWLCMQLFLVLHKAPVSLDRPDLSALAPANYMKPPPRPDGPLPRRKTRRKPLGEREATQ